MLEATTARKGNRKVSLTIYGQVNQALLIWDNGVDSDAYVVDNDNSSSRFGFKGKAKINHDWEAGYKIEIEVESASSVGVDENDDDAGNATPAIRKSFLYLKSKTLGKFSIGQNSVATDDITHDTFLSGTTGFTRPDIKYNRDFLLVDSAGNPIEGSLQWGELCGAHVADDDQCFDISGRQNSIRYDTPTFAGFTLSAAWGENDFWDVALRYAGEYGDFKVAAAIGYSEWNGDGENGPKGDPSDDDENSIAGSASIIHTPTGIFINGAYRNIEVEFDSGDEVESDNYFIQAGIAQKWNSLGKTIIWGEYANSQDGALTANTDDDVTSSDYERWGFGIAQKIDAAAMEIYALYQHHEADVDVNNVAQDVEDFDLFVVGSRIKF